MTNRVEMPPEWRVNALLEFREGRPYWRKKTGCRSAGQPAGTLINGYRYVMISKQLYAASRLAWVASGNADPGEMDIDHINGDRDDNRIENLRCTSHAINTQNQAHPKGGNKYLGVSLNKRTGRYHANIHYEGRQRFLGAFATAEEARDVYLAAKRKHHPGNIPERHNHMDPNTGLISDIEANEMASQTWRDRLR